MSNKNRPGSHPEGSAWTLRTYAQTVPHVLLSEIERPPATYTPTVCEAPTPESTIDFMINQLARGDASQVSLAVNALLIRNYGNQARDIILSKRRAYRAQVEATADKWRHSVSRRPYRGNHYDSWAARERFIREGISPVMSFQ